MSDHEELCGDCDPYDKYCHCALIARVRREVLAELLAKIKLIPAHAVRMENKWMNGQGWVPTTETIDTVPLAAVLVLIEERLRKERREEVK